MLSSRLGWYVLPHCSQLPIRTPDSHEQSTCRPIDFNLLRARANLLLSVCSVCNFLLLVAISTNVVKVSNAELYLSLFALCSSRYLLVLAPGYTLRSFKVSISSSCCRPYPSFLGYWVEALLLSSGWEKRRESLCDTQFCRARTPRWQVLRTRGPHRAGTRQTWVSVPRV
jgi:hypothetical protein